MLQGGNGYGSSVELEVCCEQFFNGGEDLNVVFGFGFGGASGIGLNCRDKSNALVG
jgi:hypothetical protein